ncbi:MAG: (2Fe-2S) ferredoxin domain-containing protein [Christensenellales bacterium]|jgi:NADP-reducing hydrogenase subunit HndB|nr:(2Fe-2S) ferredoxin domain-containing protein [Clostridiales bacterium]
MLTKEQLEVIRQRTLERIQMRKEDENQAVRVVVGMATCGIAAGARPIMRAFMDECNLRNLTHVQITQTGCVGMCRYEPMADVIFPGKDPVTYVQLTPEKVRRIVAEHVVNGQPVKEFTIGAVLNNQ